MAMVSLRIIDLRWIARRCMYPGRFRAVVLLEPGDEASNNSRKQRRNNPNEMPCIGANGISLKFGSTDRIRSECAPDLLADQCEHLRRLRQHGAHGMEVMNHAVMADVVHRDP